MYLHFHFIHWNRVVINWAKGWRNPFELNEFYPQVRFVLAYTVRGIALNRWYGTQQRALALAFTAHDEVRMPSRPRTNQFRVLSVSVERSNAVYKKRKSENALCAVDFEQEVPHLLRSPQSANMTELFERVRSLLRADGIKLWLAPYTTKGSHCNTEAIQLLASYCASVPDVHASAVEVERVLLDLRGRALEKLNGKSSEESVAPLKLSDSVKGSESLSGMTIAFSLLRPVSDLLAVLKTFTKSRVRLVFQGKILAPHLVLNTAGVRSGDMVQIVRIKDAGVPASQPASAGAPVGIVRPAMEQLADGVHYLRYWDQKLTMTIPRGTTLAELRALVQSLTNIPGSCQRLTDESGNEIGMDFAVQAYYGTSGKSIQVVEITDEESQQHRQRRNGGAGCFDTYVTNARVEKENVFLRRAREVQPLPSFAAIRSQLPRPFWANHQSHIDCYWKCWELAFQNLRQPTTDSGFVSNYIDTAFNDNLFMWDSSFILMFCRYAIRAFNFQRTLDNFYSRQHKDGFICREIRESDGVEMWNRYEVCSTGPNIMGWAEWEYYLNFGDRHRLADVFPCLLAYHEWWQRYRRWQDGTYYSSGGGSGMDNQPRLPADMRDVHNAWFYYHGHMSWIDTTFQQMLSAHVLILMAKEIGRMQDVQHLEQELTRLSNIVNASMWDERTAFYYDKYDDGSLSDLMSIGAFWGLMVPHAVPANRLRKLVQHLEDPATFNRAHRVPTLAASHPRYAQHGGYWLGAIWAPTNYMVLRGLTRNGFDRIAHDIAVNHVDNVTRVFETTGTVWENYAPESMRPGDPAKKDFVGWTGLPPIAVLFEYVFGLRPDVPNNLLVWDIRVLDEHGVDAYPFSTTGVVSLKCAGRRHHSEKPAVSISSNIPFRLRICWNDQHFDHQVHPGVENQF